MRRRLLALVLLVALHAVAEARSEDVVRRVGRVTFRVDVSRAFPGGILSVRLVSRARLGSVTALLEGRRSPFYSGAGGPRALVPVATSSGGGPATLGVEIAARGGTQRIAIPVTLGGREDRPRRVFLDDSLRALVARPDAARDGRRLLALVRTQSPKLAPGPLRPPVDAPGHGFGEPRTYVGAPDVLSRTDALQGERHRGLDYAVAAGTPVRTPGAGTVLFAGHLTLPGETVVVDHGQGVVSVLMHLGRVDVRTGDTLGAGSPVGLSGDSGLASAPVLEWRVYLHGVPVDPTALASLL